MTDMTSCFAAAEHGGAGDVLFGLYGAERVDGSGGGGCAGGTRQCL